MGDPCFLEPSQRPLRPALPAGLTLSSKTAFAFPSEQSPEKSQGRDASRAYAWGSGHAAKDGRGMAHSGGGWSGPDTAPRRAQGSCRISTIPQVKTLGQRLRRERTKRKTWGEEREEGKPQRWRARWGGDRGQPRGGPSPAACAQTTPTHTAIQLHVAFNLIIQAIFFFFLTKMK